MKFKCKLSGCIVEFTYPVDIETTLANPAYVVVEEETIVVEKASTSEAKPPLAKKTKG